MRIRETTAQAPKNPDQDLHPESQLGLRVYRVLNGKGRACGSPLASVSSDSSARAGVQKLTASKMIGLIGFRAEGLGLRGFRA